MTDDLPQLPEPAHVSGVVLARDGLPTLVVRGNESAHVAHAGAGHLYSRAALDDALRAYAAAAVAQAIEACAKLCDPSNADYPDDWTEYAKVRAECAAAIRATLPRTDQEQSCTTK